MNLQDYLTIAGSILGPIGAMIGFMWHHSNKIITELKADIKSDIGEVKADIKDVRSDIKRVEEKLDAVRDRVSRIEGQLAPTSFVAFNPPTKEKESVRSARSF